MTSTPLKKVFCHSRVLPVVKVTVQTALEQAVIKNVEEKVNDV